METNLTPLDSEKHIRTHIHITVNMYAAVPERNWTSTGIVSTTNSMYVWDTFFNVMCYCETYYKEE